ncbi:Hypothetical predicted protein [Olea europaea subsp. europaea]|uniref:Uncharacterized protein n=1 Tax=Olea europaea subsp. europaea TaxID=158383 RepID=A0A8S0VBW5_OLEEU|nr:Hypothetical predicted protein [Olea europaea subsp. europaea]
MESYMQSIEKVRAMVEREGDAGWQREGRRCSDLCSKRMVLFGLCFYVNKVLLFMLFPLWRLLRTYGCVSYVALLVVGGSEALALLSDKCKIQPLRIRESNLDDFLLDPRNPSSNGDLFGKYVKTNQLFLVLDNFKLSASFISFFEELRIPLGDIEERVETISEPELCCSWRSRRKVKEDAKKLKVFYVTVGFGIEVKKAN